MFNLQIFDSNWPREFDGTVHFTWLSQSAEVIIDVPCDNAFVEFRIGYPEADPGKTITISGKSVKDGAETFILKKGWNSYFVPVSGGKSGLSIYINKSRHAPGDTRFLGVMVS